MKERSILVLVLVPASEPRFNDTASTTRIGAGSRSYNDGWDRVFGKRQSASAPN